MAIRMDSIVGFQLRGSANSADRGGSAARKLLSAGHGVSVVFMPLTEQLVSYKRDCWI